MKNFVQATLFKKQAVARTHSDIQDGELCNKTAKGCLLLDVGSYILDVCWSPSYSMWTSLQKAIYDNKGESRYVLATFTK